MKPAVPGKIPIAEVARYPLPGTGHLPAAARVAPGNGVVTYLYSEAGDLTRQLFAHHIETGERRQMFALPQLGATEENLSPAEKLRRERMRERGLGITTYAWARDADVVMIPSRGDVWVQRGTDGTPHRVVHGGEQPALDPQISQDGAFVAYVQDSELFVVPTDHADPAPTQLSFGARGTGKTHGLAEYVAQEEMDRFHGFWWFHAGDRLAYTEVDETAIDDYPIVDQSADQPAVEHHAYPFAGGPNAKVKLGVVARTGGPTTWMDLRMDGEPEVYLARVHPMPTGELLAELENRGQTRLQLVRFDLRTGQSTVLVNEKSDVWIDLHRCFHPLEQGQGDLTGAFIWASQATGFRHLNLHAKDGTLLRALTEGPWMVDELVGVDETRKLVYFAATKDSPLQRHLYRVPLAGGEITRVTAAAGTHQISLSRDGSLFIDTHSNLAQAPTVTVRAADDGREVGTIAVEPDPRVAELGLTPPELVTLTSRDGVELHGALYKPEGSGPWPLIVSVYGGPHAQRVTDSWDPTVDMRAQYLRAQGYLVFKLDNRGSARRGLAFEGAIKHDLGNLEVQDQVDGVRWLVAQGLADPKRVGIYGWSYGGYMAAMALMRAPETFKVGVAGAMVSAWDGYDTHYTERYMGTPATNPEGYAQSSVMHHVDALVGHLMIVHGLMDENVHFRHSARLIDALVKAGKPYELLLFPKERHMPRSEADRIYMEERIARFFQAHL